MSSTPEHFLLDVTENHLISPSAPDTADVIVIGAGINGAATAYYLAVSGAVQVELLAGPPRPSQTASEDSVGLLRTHHDNVPESALAAASMQVFRDWESQFGASNGWLGSGFVRFVGHDEVETLHANARIQRDLGVNFEVLAPAALQERFPGFDVGDIGAALFEPDSGTADAWLCTQGFLEGGRELGVHVLPHEALQILRDARGVSGVRTTTGETIWTRTVVLAAGIWSVGLARTAGVSLPVEARIITVAEFAMPVGAKHLPSYMDPVSDSWFTPRSDGRALLNVRAPETGRVVVPGGVIPPVSDDCHSEGVARVSQRIPALRGTELTRAWHVADTYAPDGKPVIGPVQSLPGLYLNVAGAGKGHKVAPAVGRSLAGLIVSSGDPQVDLTPFALSRFTSGGFPISGVAYARKTIG